MWPTKIIMMIGFPTFIECPFFHNRHIIVRHVFITSLKNQLVYRLLLFSSTVKQLPIRCRKWGSNPEVITGMHFKPLWAKTQKLSYPTLSPPKGVHGSGCQLWLIQVWLAWETKFYICPKLHTHAVNNWPRLAHLINLAGPGFLSLNWTLAQLLNGPKLYRGLFHEHSLVHLDTELSLTGIGLDLHFTIRALLEWG